MPTRSPGPRDHFGTNNALVVVCALHGQVRKHQYAPLLVRPGYGDAFLNHSSKYSSWSLPAAVSIACNTAIRVRVYNCFFVALFSCCCFFVFLLLFLLTESQYRSSTRTLLPYRAREVQNLVPRRQKKRFVQPQQKIGICISSQDVLLIRSSLSNEAVSAAFS